MSVHEVVIALSFLHITLTGDVNLTSAAPGGCWPDEVPANKSAPYVIYGFMSGVDTLTANAVRLLTQPLYQVRASGPASAIDLVAAAATYVDDLLKRQTNISVPGGLVAGCYRESPLHIPGTIDGVKWVSIGGLYRMVLQQVPD